MHASVYVIVPVRQKGEKLEKKIYKGRKGGKTCHCMLKLYS